MGGSANITDRVTAIAATRQALENALLEATEILENAIEELSQSTGRLIKFRFHDKPVEPFVSNTSELMKRIVETSELVDRLETCLQKTRCIPVNDNMP